MWIMDLEFPRLVIMLGWHLISQLCSIMRGSYIVYGYPPVGNRLVRLEQF